MKMNTNTSRHCRSIAASTFLALITACGGSVTPESDPPIDDTPTDPPIEDPVAQSDCSTPNHLALTDIESVTDWLNALPRPLELPCFVESLPRPLYVNMTDGVISAQPANGTHNPRIFIFMGRLILSIVPQEKADPDSNEPPPNLLEMSYRTEGIQSIKAELAFPIEKTLSYSDAYTRVIAPGYHVTICGVCHAHEEQVNSFDGVAVYQSQMLRPYFHSKVSIGLIKNEKEYCDKQEEPHRCAMLDAFVGDGDLYWQDFDSEVPSL